MVELANTTRMKDIAQHRKKFERFERAVPQPSWLLPLRQAGMARFAELGFPTLQQEDWRFTSLAPLAKLPFKPVLAADASGITVEAVRSLTFGKLPALRRVFVDGHFVPELSTPEPAPEGAVITSLAAALSAGSAPVPQHLGRHADASKQPFTALNNAFFQDGGFIHLGPGVVVGIPIHLLFISTAKESGATTHPRNLIVAEPGSRATVLETYVSLGPAAHFTNGVTEVVAGEHSRLEHCKFQEESLAAFHLAALHADLGRGATVVSHSIVTGAKLSRHNIRLRLAGESAECILNGLYVTRADQLADHHMVVEHVEPHCNSHEYYNGILDGRSKGVFHGRIYVHQAAQKTDAKQTNKNLLLSEDATIDTKPQLEIYADDVKCTHGATVGQLNEDSIFYLRARGLGVQTARRMLIHAFAGEIIERIQHEGAREELDRLIWDRLEANPHVSEIK